MFSEKEDGAKVVRVENMDNPYKHQDNFDRRFKLTLNKLYAWSLVDYDRVVMLDADNLFLQKTDELFQCGQFCAVFINPCIFHTGLFVLQVILFTTYYLNQPYLPKLFYHSTLDVLIYILNHLLLTCSHIHGRMCDTKAKCHFYTYLSQ